MFPVCMSNHCGTAGSIGNSLRDCAVVFQYAIVIFTTCVASFSHNVLVFNRDGIEPLNATVVLMSEVEVEHSIDGCSDHLNSFIL